MMFVKSVPLKFHGSQQESKTLTLSEEEPYQKAMEYKKLIIQVSEIKSTRQEEIILLKLLLITRLVTPKSQLLNTMKMKLVFGNIVIRN